MGVGNVCLPSANGVPAACFPVTPIPLLSTCLMVWEEVPVHLLVILTDVWCIGMFQRDIQPTVAHRGFSSLRHFLMGPPRLKRTLINERDVIFCCALAPFSNDDAVHRRMLLSLYRGVTGAKLDCARYGAHWEEIGFQGKHPQVVVCGPLVDSPCQCYYRCCCCWSHYLHLLYNNKENNCCILGSWTFHPSHLNES